MLVLHSRTQMLSGAQTYRRQDLEIPSQTQAPANHQILTLAQGLNEAGAIVDFDI
jgi:hypothetical protein